ncbi:MAG: hypothetical protein R3321_15510, partial [Nitrososphaeraceae archaeon]|nr:hypothetical protein [Nitrososphaeraceae archaeon]
MKKTTYLLLLTCIFNLSGTNVAPHLKFHATKDTLAKITEVIAKKQKGAYLRFGDGELYIL